MFQRVFSRCSYASLEQGNVAELVEKSPQDFLLQFPPPVVIDEVQYAPGLFRNIKVAIDRQRHLRGQFLLTGSQSFVLMKGVSDSLAGRCAILELESLRAGEIASAGLIQPDHAGLLRLLGRGAFPQLWSEPDIEQELFYRSYVSSYLERDLRQVINVTRLRDFERFLRSCAVRAGQILNQSELARDVGITSSTAGAWISALQACHVVFLLEPYFTNLGKRLTKSPKLYFTETGLLCHLLDLNEKTLPRSPHLGPVWENYILSELRRHLQWTAPAHRLYFYRDQQLREVDIVVEGGGEVCLLEVKWTERPEKNDVRTMRQIAALMAKAKPYPIRVARQGIVCRTPNDYPIDQESEAIHWFRFPERLFAKDSDERTE